MRAPSSTGRSAPAAQQERPLTPEAALPAILIEAYEPDVRARGRGYEVQGRVTFVASSERHRDATVLGTSRYSVRLTHVGSTLFVECTCPVAHLCKHTWATILTATRRQDALGLDLSGVRSVRTGRPSKEDELHAAAPAVRVARGAEQLPIPSWRARLEPLLDRERDAERSIEHTPVELRFVLDAETTRRGSDVVLHVWQRAARSQRWYRMIGLGTYGGLVNDADHALLAMLVSRPVLHSRSRGCGGLAPLVAPEVLRGLAASGRLHITNVDMDAEPTGLPLARFDDGPAWRAAISVEDHDDGSLRMVAALARGDERIALSDVRAFARCGLAVLDDAIVRVEEDAPYALLEGLRGAGPIDVPPADREVFAMRLLESPSLAAVELPPSLGVTDVFLPSSYGVEIGAPAPSGYSVVEAWVEIDGRRAPLDASSGALVDIAARRRLIRDRALDDAARSLLRELGSVAGVDRRGVMTVFSSSVPALVRRLLDEGWTVLADGRRHRKAGAFTLHATSGIDWFDLNGDVDFDGVSANLPQLLVAMRSAGFVRLGDGSVGVLPEDWLARWGRLTTLATPADGKLRFGRNQVAILDVLLASQPEATFDDTLARLREELREFRTPSALDPPSSFRGVLRPYQREGLGWLAWLARLGLGGCLADDMGLGKTVQVLAYLLHRRETTTKRGPSLVVAPRSVVEHWVDEAARFAPDLSVLAQIGVERSLDPSRLAATDLLVTSYATLRRDAPALASLELDCLVLDEATALKNPDTATSKAARLLRARQRFALSGTPVENHLGELWSVFDAVSPGMLGTATMFRELVERSNDASKPTLDAVARAVRPFLLRRRKREVAQELPDRTEETLRCRLGPEQRARYDALARHYRDSLLGRVRRDGLERSSFHVLEALLRLRQAALHTGLLDPASHDADSAKLDALFEQLEPILDDPDEPHKVLVFSQLTSLLDLVEPGLRQRGITFERLDGSTRDRAPRIARFQDDPSVRVFLISLKAGGLGVTLTAADYVFLLDPWWNPAVEAQAIDRAHRIGQRRPVVAYRLISENTIEERVTELQDRKRALADAILESDAGSRRLADLTVADLEHLLS